MRMLRRAAVLAAAGLPFGRHGAMAEEAAAYMERRLTLARASGDPERMAAAADALDVLRSKIAAAGPP